MKPLKFQITVFTAYGVQRFTALAASSVDAVIDAAEQFGIGVKIRATVMS